VNPVSDSPQALYLEDLRVGQRFDSAMYLMEADRMKAFAAEFDPQPFHLDEAAAEHTMLRGLAASGWHTAAATMRLLMTGGLPIAGGLIGLSAEMAWPNPTRPGDTLRVESEILEIVPSRSKPDRAVVTVRCVTFNQKGDKVQIMTTKVMVFRRPSPTP
jgi:acyl dehydratase